ncbi:MAG TPA: TolC family protein [Kofleriaceae bacterium]
MAKPDKAPFEQAEAPPPFQQPREDDPMLAPPETAPAELKSWDDALAAIRRSPDFQISATDIERALAQRRIALAAVLPNLTGTASYTHNFKTLTFPLGGVTITSPPPNVWQVSASASWEVVNPRGIYGIGTADIQTEVAKLSFADRRRVLAGSVVSAMISTLSSERVAELNRVGLRTSLERLTLTQTRLKFGSGIELDVDRAQQDVAASRSQVISGDESLRQAREALGQVLGSATPMSAPVGLDLEGFEKAVAGTCRFSQDVEHRPDIAAAAQRVALADRAVTDAELLFAPTLALGSTAAHTSEPTLGPDNTWAVAATVSVPFYDGGARYGRIRDAKAVAKQARSQLAAAKVDALIEIARASRAISVDTQSRDVARQQRDLAARIDQRTREGYARGVGTSLDLVTSAQALRQAEINLVLLDFEVAQARASAVLVNAECVY